MSEEMIKLGDLLKDHVNGEIVNKNITRLTAPGENFGSLMLKVDVTVRNKSEEEVLNLVAKCVIPNKKMQEIFKVQTTFKNEIGWYKEAIPALKNFQKEQSMEPSGFFMKVYGARISLDQEKDEVDENGVIMFENLAVKGFKNANRRKGFNMVQSLEVIKKLAEFHATTLALKLKHPAIFDQKIKRYLSFDKHEKKPCDIFQPVLDTLKDSPETKHLVSKVEEIRDQSTVPPTDQKQTREPWATALHKDFWVNNVMIKEEDNGKPPKVIILDLQVCGYGSPAEDLLFFLFTSIETSIAEMHFDNFIKLYYDELKNNLKAMKVELDQFSYESFERELQLEALEQFHHIMFFIPIIMADKGGVSDVTSDEFDPIDDMVKLFSSSTKEHKEKHVFLVKKFAEKKWI